MTGSNDAADSPVEVPTAIHAPTGFNVGRLLVNAALRTPEAPAITWGSATLTYRQFDQRSNALAHALSALGLAKGDRVAVLMRNRPELLETMFACFKAGFCLVPMNAKFTSEEIEYHVADSEAAAVITDPEGASVMADASLADAHVVVAGAEAASDTGFLGYEDLVAAEDGERSATVAVDRDDLAWLFYTSGTTGRPKGAMLTHGNLAFVAASWLADLTPMAEGEVTLHAAPLSHGAGFHAVAVTGRGSHQLIPTDGRFEPEAIITLMRDTKVSNTWLVPTQIVMLIDALGDRAPDLPDLRHVVYGGAPFAPADLHRALEVFGPVFVQLYAQGETPMTATVLPREVHAQAMAGVHAERLGSAGYARPGMDVRVLGSDDEDLAPDEPGEVCVRGPAVMLGYWNRPDATAETLRNGWLHTGDLGRMDATGYLYLLDRAKDLIITGGSNVYAVEVEAVLAAHRDVREVAVIGIADRTWGEIVAAVVVTSAAPAQVQLELTAAANESLAGYKRPRRYEFIDALPRNAYGKVLKRELRDRFAPS
ncbi:MAG: AMP-binding protein [Acidimicrobiia bacterium]